MSNNFAPYDPSTLPSLVVTYLDAQQDHRYTDALAHFTPDAVVIDDGKTYRGIDEISQWLTRSVSEYEYISTRIGQHQSGEAHVSVRIRLEGNFPGGAVALRYLFELDAGKISHLTITV
ncbi:hypothetical protein K8P10_001394 [Leucobacter sp. Psy1]|uniref:nuclear transport factor 2 family protein n=1 Tax=Leucobacter sp. Psy1 TaxID=2875729 RepID=UPI001CD5E271|nr:nuclear transport factor 2 family protein [Leucobacter sp. Psy1]UBH05883.1 hypothetical protein K8P10_001394 [Leucobacter sp. Psy1]